MAVFAALPIKGSDHTLKKLSKNDEFAFNSAQNAVWLAVEMELVMTEF